ncbi:MAG: PEP-CTERM sorting domain-containing protein [Bryobacteraceae bacterium]
MKTFTIATIRILGAAAVLVGASAHAATITGGIYTNFCNGALGSATLGAYSGSCSSGDSNFTVSGDAEGSGVTFGDTITASDSSIDTTASGNFGWALTNYQDQVNVSTPGTMTLNFSVEGTSSNIDGDYAGYFIDALLCTNEGCSDAFEGAGNVGTGSGDVSLTLEDAVAAGTYTLDITTEARFCFWGCIETVSQAAAKDGEMASDTSNFLNTFQITSVTDSGGGTVIGADGTNFTDLGAVPEPNSLWFVGLAAICVCILSRRKRRSTGTEA